MRVLCFVDAACSVAGHQAANRTRAAVGESRRVTRITRRGRSDGDAAAALCIGDSFRDPRLREQVTKSETTTTMMAVDTIPHHRCMDMCHEPRVGLAPLLNLQPILPQRFHKGVDATLRIDNIEWVEVAGASVDANDGKTYYTINVFIKKDQSRLPLTRLHLKPTAKRPLDAMKKPARAQPDFQVRRTFDEFELMTDDIMAAITKSHGQYCHLCNNFQSLLLFSSSRMAMSAKMLLSTDSRAHIVAKFVRKVVAQFQNRLPGSGRRDGCEAAHEIPMILYAFLFDFDSEDDD